MNIEKELEEEEIIINFLKYIENLSKNKIETISKLINKKKLKIFPTNKLKLLGEQSKKISDKDFWKIISFEEKEKIKLAYIIQYYMGLRIGEVVKIKKEDIINWNLTIKNEKCKRRETRTIPIKIRKYIQNFYLKNYKKINEHKFLFFSSNPVQKRKNISKDWLRINFTEIVKKAKLQKSYSKSKDGRTLNLITSHSLRYSFGNRFYEKSEKDIEKTRIALRHKLVTDTQNYIKSDINSVNKIMEQL